MFFKVRVLDQKGGLKKVITSEVLSQRHWNLFSDSLRNSTKKKHSRTRVNARKDRGPDLDVVGFEGC